MSPQHPTSNPKHEPQPERRDQPRTGKVTVPDHTKVPGNPPAPVGPTKEQLEHPKQP